MNWVNGICTENTKIVAAIVNREGTWQTCSLQNLATFGIPRATGLLRRNNISSNFRDWKIVSATRYLAAYHYRPCMKIKSHHQMFEFQVRDTKFQVPALVLIRAIFYPSKHLLADAFGPQCLNNLGCFDDNILELTSGATRKSGYRWVNDSVRSRLGWMYAFPSAHRMAHSIHEHAMSGIIGLSLPDATITWALSGRKLRNTYYVTAMNASMILAQEPAFSYMQNIPSTVLGYGISRRRRANETISLRNGLASVSDEEWDAIAPILLKRSSYQFRLSQRDLLDCVLEKLCSGLPWRMMSCRSGTYVNAIHAHRYWKQRGTFAPAIEHLKLMRCRA